MIKLTRLGNQPLVLNAELVKTVEEAPDTVITLTTGEKLVVLEKSEEIVRCIIAYRRSLLGDPLAPREVPPLTPAASAHSGETQPPGETGPE